MISKANSLLEMYKELGVPPSKLIFRLPATWAGLQAAGALEARGIATQAVLVYSLIQGVAAAQVTWQQRIPAQQQVVFVMQRFSVAFCPSLHHAVAWLCASIGFMRHRTTAASFSSVTVLAWQHDLFGLSLAVACCSRPPWLTIAHVCTAGRRQRDPAQLWPRARLVRAPPQLPARPHGEPTSLLPL